MSPLNIWICPLPGLILRGYPLFHWDDSSENSMFYFPATPARISASELNSAQFRCLRVRFSKSNWTSLRQTCQWGLGYTLWDLNISNYGKYGSIIILCWYIIYTNVFFFHSGLWNFQREATPLKMHPVTSINGGHWYQVDVVLSTDLGNSLYSMGFSGS